ncbi:MAG: hypothetical protein COT18_10175 [Elusimicrobia bacterium CG08_land_8_20_14_0_20_59_10]|nr:MAG: hypothetical protein COT18_10175 [Elusimicrobia bacterium CG08_land_8_20_14_0_20_59_10]
MPSAEKKGGALRWLQLAWDDYFNGFKTLFPVLLFLTALNVPLFWLVHRYNSYLPALAYLLLAVTPLTTGANLVYIRLARGEKTSFYDLFSAFPVYRNVVAVSVWLGLITMAGTLAFLIPGLILYTTYCFSEYAVVDRRTGVRESFSLSSSITPGYRDSLLLIVAFSAAMDFFTPNPVGITGKFSAPQVAFNLKPWVIAGFCLKTLVFLPWLHMAMARAYNALLPKESPPPPAGQPS